MAKQERTKKDYLNLLQETINYYTVEENERAFDGISCKYYTQGKMCAVGRCLVNPKDKDRKLGFGLTSVSNLLSIFGERVFKKEYRGFDLSFWIMLQQFHDGQFFFNGFKLTEDGEYKVGLIKEWIEANVK